MIALTVTADFADFKRGDQITDPALVTATLAGSNAVNVVRVTLPNPAPSDPAPS